MEIQRINRCRVGNVAKASHVYFWSASSTYVLALIATIATTNAFKFPVSSLRAANGSGFFDINMVIVFFFLVLN